jgi:hypothetical protein
VLTSEAKRLVNKPELFALHCGREYVSQERRVVHAAATYTFHNLTDVERRHVQASLNASYGSGPFSVDGQMSVDEIMNSLKTVYQVKVSVFAIGGEGVTKLKDLGEQDDLSQVRAILTKYIEGQSEDRATPVEYLTSSWQSLGVDLEPPVMYYRRLALSEYYFLFRDMQTRLEQYGERLRRLISLPTQTTQTQLEIDVYRKQYEALSARLKAVQQRALACLSEPEDGCGLNLDFGPLPLVPAAEFEYVWEDRDASGRPYQAVVWYNGAHVQAGQDISIRLGFDPNSGDVRVKTVSSRCLNRCDQIQYTGQTQSVNHIGFNRYWGDDETIEEHYVFYEVRRRVCVKYCFGS